MARVGDLVETPNHVFQLVDRDKLGNGKFAHGQQQRGLQHLNLRVQPRATRSNLFSVGYTVATLGVLAWKTPADGSHIGAMPKCFLAEPNGVVPFEQRFPSRPRERLAGRPFFVAGCLTHHHDG